MNHKELMYNIFYSRVLSLLSFSLARMMDTFFVQKQSQYIFPCIEAKMDILTLDSLLSRASGRYFSLQFIPLPRADAIVSYGVRSAVIYVGSTYIDLIATRDKIRFITVKRDSKKTSYSVGVFSCEVCFGK